MVSSGNSHYVGWIGTFSGMGFHTQKRSGSQRAAKMEIPVQVISTALKPLTYSMRVTGDIMPLMQVDLFPKVSGYLERIDVTHR